MKHIEHIELEPIKTDCICPPIPIRRFDWCAYRDPEGIYGYGPTEAEAISDFLLTEDPPFYVIVDEARGRVLPNIVPPNDYKAGEHFAQVNGFELVDSGG